MTRDLGIAGEDYQVSLWGAVPHPALELWSDQFALPLHLQAAGDLGQKMLHGFASALDAGADQAVLIGSDCPAMTAEYIRQACAALRASDLVLGPAEDGGYVLIGCKQVYAELFANIPWGSDKVLARTLEQAEQLELSVTLLATLWDVDRPEDWARFQRMTIDSVGSG
jgi:rSAM/selenodomain-associated transferase 1